MRALLPLLAALLTPSCSAQEGRQPDARLTPAEVVRIQLEALKANDRAQGNDGIRLAFRFASPSNREATGPIDRFIALLRSPPYRALLNYRSAEFFPARIEGDEAVQRVRLITAGGGAAVYVFLLTRQTEAPYNGCWMTDGVERVPDRDGDPLTAQLSGNGYNNGFHAGIAGWRL